MCVLEKDPPVEEHVFKWGQPYYLGGGNSNLFLFSS